MVVALDPGIGIRFFTGKICRPVMNIVQCDATIGRLMLWNSVC